MLEGYSIKDEKAGTFSAPFFVKNAVVAMRSVQDVANDPQSQLNKFPDDFSLHYVCLFVEDGEHGGDIEAAQTHLVIRIAELIRRGPTGGASNGN